MAVNEGGSMRWGAWVGYTLFAVLMFLAGLVLTFPLEQVVKRLVSRTAAETGWNIIAKGPALQPPFTLRFSRLGGQPPDGPALVLSDVNIRLRPMGLKDDLLILDHTAKGYGGRLTGHLEVEGPATEPGYKWEGALERVDLAKLPLKISELTTEPWAEGMTVAGRFSADGGAGWRADQVMRGNGELNLSLDDLVIQAPKTPMGKMSLPVGTVTGRVGWQRGRIDITDLVLEGDLLQARGSGRIMLGTTPRQTRLDLRLTGQLGGAFPMRELVIGMLKTKGKAVTITLKGDMANPVLYVNGKTLNRLMLGR